VQVPRVVILLKGVGRLDGFTINRRNHSGALSSKSFRSARAALNYVNDFVKQGERIASEYNYGVLKLRAQKDAEKGL
jgi:hypothetical protein